MGSLRRTVRPSIKDRRLLGPDESYELFPTFKKLSGLPYIPPDREIRKVEEAPPEKLTSKSNSKKLMRWTRGIQREVAKVAGSSKPAEERGRIIAGLAETYERVCVQTVRFMHYSRGIPTPTGHAIIPQPGVRYPFPGVVAEGERYVVPPGERTVEEDAGLYGRVMRDHLIQMAFAGKGDLIAVARDAAGREKQGG